MRFYIDDVSRRHSPKRTDSTAPFDLLGGTTKTATAWWTTALKEGTHHLTAAVTSTSGKTTVVQACLHGAQHPEATRLGPSRRC